MWLKLILEKGVNLTAAVRACPPLPNASPPVSPFLLVPAHDVSSSRTLPERMLLTYTRPISIKETWALNYLTDCTLCEVIQVPKFVL